MDKLMVAKGEGIEGPRWKRWRDEVQAELQNSNGDVKYTIVNIDNNIVITVWCQVGTWIIEAIIFINLFKCLISMLYIWN